MMKKFYFLALFAAAVFSACSSSDNEQYTDTDSGQVPKEDSVYCEALVVGVEGQAVYVRLVYASQSFGTLLPQDTSLPYYLSFKASDLPGMVYESGKYITFKLVEHHVAEGNHTTDAVYLAGTVAPCM